MTLTDIDLHSIDGIIRSHIEAYHKKYHRKSDPSIYSEKGIFLNPLIQEWKEKARLYDKEHANLAKQEIEKKKTHSQEHHEYWFHWCKCGHHVKNHLEREEYCLDGKLMYNDDTKEYEQKTCSCKKFTEIKRVF